mmetsp:Transcript_14225/g.31146  ORF Transcript_14225/g.31146 Transcript_14225/m.31146 type:complete len:118 (+) Transcript_14225:79-432(+)
MPGDSPPRASLAANTVAVAEAPFLGSVGALLLLALVLSETVAEALVLRKAAVLPPVTLFLVVPTASLKLTGVSSLALASVRSVRRLVKLLWAMSRALQPVLAEALLSQLLSPVTSVA